MGLDTGHETVLGNLRKSKKNGSISGNFEIWKTDPFGVLLWKNDKLLSGYWNMDQIAEGGDLNHWMNKNYSNFDWLRKLPLILMDLEKFIKNEWLCKFR
ncbi:hypothetical protein RhiirA4_484996 [Rhizophagus irregularis]|uniref:Uncharacterized protein n=1 Tax=Rhizophagus irregularis TaxID=588596 RepID=A0A2I1HPN4_9GLOM|nr:hypothetical protein RhiirA4_484996 [Rhizophagus irregularis]